MRAKDEHLPLLRSQGVWDILYVSNFLLQLCALYIYTKGASQHEKRDYNPVIVSLCHRTWLTISDLCCTCISIHTVHRYLMPDQTKASKKKTAVVKRTLNPEFHEEFIYNVPRNIVHKRSLEVTVWNHSLPRNTFLGELTAAVY